MLKLIINFDELRLDASIILRIVRKYERDHLDPIADGKRIQNTRIEILIPKEDLEMIDNLKMVYGFDYVCY